MNIGAFVDKIDWSDDDKGMRMDSTMARLGVEES